jgi:hypothetical protein
VSESVRGVIGQGKDARLPMRGRAQIGEVAPIEAAVPAGSEVDVACAYRVSAGNRVEDAIEGCGALAENNSRLGKEHQCDWLSNNSTQGFKFNSNGASTTSLGNPISPATRISSRRSSPDPPHPHPQISA